MPTDAELLTTARTALLTAIAEWDYAKPSYSKAGQSVQWTAHMEALLRQKAALDAAIVQAEGPWELETEGQSG
jgi:hypothetical protein